MRIWASEVAAVTAGELVGPDVEIDGATQDSRSVTPGCLFVPLVAERDGHAFIAEALAAGASAYLTHRVASGSDGKTAIRVADTSEALTNLGTAARRSIGVDGGRVVGITGSVGKTSTKDLLSAVLGNSGLVHASRQSFNNDIGVPLTLVGAPTDVRHVVVEMGARSIGDIGRLVEVAQPDVGVLITVAAAHTEVFGSLEAVADTKGEIFDALPPNGCAVVTADVPEALVQARRARCPILTFGVRGEVRASNIQLDAALRPSFRMESPWGRTDVHLEARGAHMVTNALAASAVGLVEGVGLDDIAAGLMDAGVSPWRMEVVEASGGCTVVNDAYNANPTSVVAALEALAALPGSGRKIAVLGLMAELGDDSPDAHVAVAVRAASLGIDVLAVGTDLYGAEKSEIVDGVDAARTWLTALDLGAGDAVLVKGSRVTGLEKVAEGLLKE
ncbi:MAG: UDP-N-acetylmuramoylalanyl-D-glutamyl-2, 6-diaminopimelate--D-alanyl-D-alanine ligase [Acidimicrobiaceae bacterium]|nr:UDP-N-acetylmuramoylalanyl-D-glutamyl-2, 6-diaminopimelate--D-alanyl-D-alanine ligase [Acidimicrobiaceae bacterium]